MCKLGIMMYMKTFGKSKVETYKVALTLLNQIFTNHATKVLFIKYFKHILILE